MAIIALIATPIVLGIIKDAKKEAAIRSVENYFDVIEFSISNEYLKDFQKNVDGMYEIIEDGKYIQSENNKIKVEYDGVGLSKGTIKIENGKIVETNGIIIYSWYVFIDENSKMSLVDVDSLKTSSLVSGKIFNERIKTLANKTTTQYNTDDTKVTSIEFYTVGFLPYGYSIETLEQLPKVSLSDDNTITGYFEESTGKVYVYSKNIIMLNADASYMFLNFKGLTDIKFKYVKTNETTNMLQMFNNCSNLISLDVSNFNTSNFTNMIEMFSGCSNLMILDLSSFDISNVKNMLNMFYNTTNLKPIYVGENWGIGETANTEGMFYGSKTTKMEELCEPNSTEEWCIVTN